jgi:hypothetical protein
VTHNGPEHFDFNVVLVKNFDGVVRHDFLTLWISA